MIARFPLPPSGLALALVFLAVQTATGSPGVYDVREYGARGDGTTSDTAAINRAVAACGDAGGGLVRFPPGRYLSGTVRLRASNRTPF